jgi:hypothetical protein
MPRIDPITGCSVMTFVEFVAAEAAREGKETGDVMDDIFGPLAEDDRRIENEWRDPAKALEIIRAEAELERTAWQESKDCDPGYDEPEPPTPVEILAVLGARHSQGLRGSDGVFTARVRCADGSVRYAVHSDYYDGGDRMTPPDGGSETTWYEEPLVGEPERAMLRRVHETFIHREDWYKECDRDAKMKIEIQGLIGQSGARVMLSALGRLALGLGPEG